MKKFYIVSIYAEDDYHAIYELTDAEANGIRKVSEGKSLFMVYTTGGHCAELCISETGYKTPEEAEEALYDTRDFN